MRELLHGLFEQFVIKYNLLEYHISRSTNSAGFVKFFPGDPLPSPALPCPPLEVAPLFAARGVGERLSSPTGSGGARPPNVFWCILAVKSDIWLQQFLVIFLRTN